MYDGDGGSAASNRISQFARACPTAECKQDRCAPLRDLDIELLACIAARLAGQDPDRHTTIKFGNIVAFDDVAWRYPDFLARAEAAYQILEADGPPALPHLSTAAAT